MKGCQFSNPHKKLYDSLTLHSRHQTMQALNKVTGQAVATHL